MFLNEILDIRKLDKSRMKIVRNTISRNGMKEIIDNNHFELYQSIQKNNIFKDIDYIISFIGTEGTSALLYRCYKVNGVQMIRELPESIISSSSSENWGDGPYYKYDIERDNALADLEERLVIDWGNATLSWHQRKFDKRIVEIKPDFFL